MHTDECFSRSYDFDTLDKIPKDKVVIFVVSLKRVHSQVHTLPDHPPDMPDLPSFLPDNPLDGHIR